jgi:hypothetical protein
MATEGANPNDRTQYKAPLIEGELPPSLYTLHHLFGFDSHRRSNLSYLEEVRQTSQRTLAVAAVGRRAA